MFGSNLLDVAIGLIFVYLIFSLVVTVINEIIATYLGLRAKDLEQAIGRMLSTGAFSKEFYEHPLIRSLAKDNKSRPSYIEPATFSRVVTDILQPRGRVASLSTSIRAFAAGVPDINATSQPLPPDIRLLLGLAGDAQDNVEEFRKKLEDWFNETMNRVTGWYQRKIKIITLFIGLVITIIFNVDSVKIYKTLSTNNKVRGEVIVAATKYFDTYGVSGDEGSVTRQKLDELLCDQIDPTVNILGIGWPHNKPYIPASEILSAVAGWLLTTLALSLGAPFWFDMLSRIMKLRGTGTQVPTNTSEPRPQPVG